MVFSSIGNFSAKTAEAVAARYFAGQAASARGFGRVAPAPCAAFEKTVVKHTHQTHCIIGNRAYGIIRPLANNRIYFSCRKFLKHILYYLNSCLLIPFGGLLKYYFNLRLILQIFIKAFTFLNLRAGPKCTNQVSHFSFPT